MEQLYPVVIALVFNGTDIFTGILSAVKNKDIHSAKLRDGLFKKVGFILTYFLAWLIDNYGKIVGFDITVKLLPVIVAYVCITELVSILENISKINPDLVPDKLFELFHIKKG